MTDEELDAIERRCSEATEGPWEYFEEDQAHVFEGEKLWRYGVWNKRDQHPVVCMSPIASDNCADRQVSDMDFVAEARQDVPALVAEVRRLRAQVAAHAERIAAQSALLTRQAEAKWTKEPPTAPGVYWCLEPGHRPYVREMRESDIGRDDLAHCEWSGPLEPPC